MADCFGSAAYVPRPTRRHEPFAREFLSTGVTVFGPTRGTGGQPLPHGVLRRNSVRSQRSPRRHWPLHCGT
jgi:hypothetical protein